MTKEARIYECRKSLLTLFHASDFVILSSLDIRHSDSTTFAMHPELRARFNADCTPEKYAAFLRCVNESTAWPAHFRISETPILLTREFTNEAVYASNNIEPLTQTADVAKRAASAN